LRPTQKTFLDGRGMGACQRISSARW